MLGVVVQIPIHQCLVWSAAFPHGEFHLAFKVILPGYLQSFLACVFTRRACPEAQLVPPFPVKFYAAEFCHSSLLEVNDFLDSLKRLFYGLLLV